MYQTVKDGVMCKLKTAERVGITSDTWTSVATESYMSVTVHYIDELWNLVSYVLQTTEVEANHRSVCLAEMLTKAMEEWGLMSKDPAIVTDNAANMQPAISAALLSPDVRRNEKDLCSLKEEDITDAEDVVRALKPMKTATQVMSEEKCPTLSVIAPLHAQLLKEMTSLPEDSRVVKDMKDEIKKNLSTRYVNQKDMLYIASAIDPRFKALPFLNEEERDKTFSRLQTEAVCGMEEDPCNQDDAADEVDGVEEEVEPQPPAPKQFKQSSALESLLGEAYRPQQEVGPQKTKAAEAEDEIKRYRERRPAGLQDNPLIWWRENEKEYPLLACMAKRYLCVPGTSVTSERVFSTAGDIITAKRSCLTPGHVNELLFLQKNLSIPDPE
ncbi:E3 SUMO-protein ligase ZBED1-like [Xyrauchen texanus]|uniref:E3 SUMO-protein ligase ZBED1-like n=1 Tax=Xyrauchen texanus TaxID=154827 RepID=UPI0022428E21|nr:E3 SUMO-protein ligase ZBED1-like [Xyrauchen texanus]